MRSRGHSPAAWACWAAALAGALTAPAIASPLPRLLTHCSQPRGDGRQTFWLGWIDILHPSAVQTLILYRPLPGESGWRSMPPIPSRIDGMTEHGGELVVVFRDGWWAWYSESADISRFSYGPRLPQGLSLEGMAGEGPDLWALCICDEGLDEANAAAASRPATMPADGPWVLCQLLAGRWQKRPARWPIHARPDAGDLVALSLVNGTPHIATWSPKGWARIYRHEPDPGSWSVVAEAGSVPQPARFKLLDVDREAAIWAVDSAGAGRLFRGGQWTDLHVSENLPPEDQDLTVAGEQLRLVFCKNDRLFEQRFSIKGQPQGAPAQITFARSRSQPSSNWMMTGLMALVAILVLSSLLRSRQARRGDGQS